MKVNHNAFKRSIDMAAQISLFLGLGMKMPDIFGALGPYVSRGRGRGGVNAKTRHGNKPGKYLPHQGVQECARRRKAMGGAA